MFLRLSERLIVVGLHVTGMHAVLVVAILVSPFLVLALARAYVLVKRVNHETKEKPRPSQDDRG
jgi:hypothetical protein